MSDRIVPYDPEAICDECAGLVQYQDVELVKSEGCLAFYTRINDKDLDDVDFETKKKVMYQLLRRPELEEKINSIIEDLCSIMTADKFEDLGECDQCFDSVWRQIYKLRIPK